MQNEYSLHFLLALWSFILGVFLSAVYDVFRLTRLMKRKQSIFTVFVSDFVFCIISSLCMTVLFFNLSYGRMRGYAFVLVLVGFYVWRITMGRLFMALMRRAVDLVSGLLNSIKMRVCHAYKKQMRRIYTASYCSRNLKIRIKRKEIKNDGKETDTR